MCGRPQPCSPGSRTSRSNEISCSEEQLWRTYMTLTDLDAVFRRVFSNSGMSLEKLKMGEK
jgi:hypothetical protein